MDESANADQRERWNRAEHWVREQDAYDAMLAPFGDRMLAAADLEAGEALVDVGCGTGATTCLAARTVGTALGVDIAEPMAEAARARARARRLENVDFIVADAQTHRFEPASRDVAISRFGVMFFADPVAAFANLRKMLKSGGRLTFICWQDLAANEWMMVPCAAALAHVPVPTSLPRDAPGPFAFGDRDRLHTLLADAGYRSIEIEPLVGSLLVRGGGGADEAMAFYEQSSMSEQLFAEVDADLRARALDAIREAIESHTTPEGVRLGAAAWIVRARPS